MSNTIIIIENGYLNFNGNNHILNNTVLIVENGGVNLANVDAENLTVLSAYSINVNGNSNFTGTNLLATKKSWSTIAFNGNTNANGENDNLTVISQGNITVNAKSDTRGVFLAGKNFSFNGNSTLVGGIGAKGNITINGVVTVISDSNDDDTVENLNPVINEIIGDTEVNEGQQVTYSATATDAESDILTYSWDFGDGNTAVGETVNHVFAENGDYTVILTVTDEDGGVSSESIDTTVNDVVDNVITKVKFIQDKLKSKVLEDGVEVEKIKGKQNRSVSDDLESITITAFDSPDGYKSKSKSKVDVTFLDKGDGIGIKDGQDGNSKLKKRIDGDEMLTISINDTDKYNSAINAVITLDQIDSIDDDKYDRDDDDDDKYDRDDDDDYKYDRDDDDDDKYGYKKHHYGKHHDDRDELNSIKVFAFFNGEIVWEGLFNVTNGKEQISLATDTPFDSLGIMAGDDNTKFTFRGVEFDAVKTQ